MKLYLPLLSTILVLASCTTAYKTGQTPDDVYYSPERQRDEYVRVKEKDDRQYRGQLLNDEDLREERYLRMKTSYRRYANLDDCECYCYNGSNYYGYNNYYRYNNWGHTWGMSPYYYNPVYINPYYYNPYYNKPYYSGFVAGNVRPVYNRPRGTNLNTYDNNGNNYNANYPKSNGKTYSSTPSSSDENYRNSGTNAGGFLRNIFGSGNSNSNSNSSSSSNSSNNSSSSSSSSSNSSSSSGSSSAPVRKF